MEDNHNNMAGRIDVPFLYENNDDYFLLLYTCPQERPKIMVTLTSFLCIKQQEEKSFLLFNQNTVK